MARLTRLGITDLEDDPTVLDERPEQHLTEMQDPEGNEFCVIE